MTRHPAVSLFPEWTPRLRRLARLANYLLAKSGVELRLERVINACSDMTTTEQRLCMSQLLTDVVQDGVEGDVAEIGCFEGKTAVLFTRLLMDLHDSRRVHVYDSFGTAFFLGSDVNIEDRLRANFHSAGASLPIIHRGFFEETIPAELPSQISYAHLDCGTGGDVKLHQAVLTHCLTHLYARLSPGGVCILMDYNDGTFPEIRDILPAVRLAVDEFLSDKLEKPIPLWGGQVGLAYFRRSRSDGL